MPPRSPLAPLLLVAATGFAPTACVEPEDGVPLDQPVFPTGMALAGDRLLVVSSDFNLAEDEGALLSADLQAVREVTEGTGSNDVVEGAFVDAAVLPPFGDRPVVTSGGERVYVPTGGENRVVVLDIAADGTLSCPETQVPDDGKRRPRAVQVCGNSTSAMQLPANDPFAVLILEETPSPAERAAADPALPLVRVDGLITMKLSPFVFFFSDDTSREGAARAQVTSSIELPEIFGGIRAAVLRPETNGTERVVIAAMDLARDLDLFGGRLGLFFPNAGGFGDDGAGDGELKTFDVSLVTGSLSMRDVVLVPGEDGEDDALVVVLREPDGLARFEIDDVGGLPDLRLTAVASTCKEPTALARASLTGDAGSGGAEVIERVVVACHAGDVVEAIDPLTLRTTDAVRFAGRGPYDVVVHDPAPAGEGELEVFVSFFLDGSIGALRFANGKLEHTGRIGAADPRPEDGRE